MSRAAATLQLRDSVWSQIIRPLRGQRKVEGEALCEYQGGFQMSPLSFVCQGLLVYLLREMNEDESSSDTWL